MSEAKKVAIGVVGGVLGIAALFSLVLMIAGKGEEPAPRPQLLLAEQPKPAPSKLEPVRVQPQALLAEQPLTKQRAAAPAEQVNQYRSPDELENQAQAGMARGSEPEPGIEHGGSSFIPSYSGRSSYSRGTPGTDVHVRGYTRRNGAYVAPYTRSRPGSGRGRR